MGFAGNTQIQHHGKTSSRIGWFLFLKPWLEIDLQMLRGGDRSTSTSVGAFGPCRIGAAVQVSYSSAEAERDGGYDGAAHPLTLQAGQGFWPAPVLSTQTLRRSLRRRRSQRDFTCAVADMIELDSQLPRECEQYIRHRRSLGTPHMEIPTETTACLACYEQR